jgi:hypothetical protein
MAFEQFADIALWILMIFLVVNTTVFYFSNSDTFIANNIGVPGITSDSRFTTDSNASSSANFLFITLDCSPAGVNAATAAPCFMAQAYNGFSQMTGAFFGFLTNWTHLLDAILPNWIPGAELIKSILIPIFGLIEFVVIFIVVMQIAGLAAIIFRGLGI